MIAVGLLVRQWRVVLSSFLRPGIVFDEPNQELLSISYTIDRFHLHPHPNLHSMKLSVIFVKDLVDLILRAAIDGDESKREA
jgi:hypothetical protein